MNSIHDTLNSNTQAKLVALSDVMPDGCCDMVTCVGCDKQFEAYKCSWPVSDDFEISGPYCGVCNRRRK